MTLNTTNHAADRQKRHTFVIIDKVAEHYGFTRAQLLAPGRTAEVVVPRQMAMALARELTKASSPDLAGWFQREDHGTVLHACRVAKRMRRTDLAYKRWMDDLRRLCCQQIERDGLGNSVQATKEAIPAPALPKTAKSK